MINFAHISPISYLPLVKTYPVHLLLAHLVEESPAYRDFYIQLKKDNPNVFYHLDNSAFEMFKRGSPMYDPDKLIAMGKLVQADSIVMSDYPKEHWTKTVESAERLIPQFMRAGFKTFFCPQSELGDLEGLMMSFKWALENKMIDYIGVSILACPIALGVNESTHSDHGRDESYRMQRYLSRWAILQELNKRGMLQNTFNPNSAYKRFHCLGMTDGPREIELLADYHQYIFSWDSSTAIWHGLNGIQYDSSPTGLMRGKFEDEVDFYTTKPIDIDIASRIQHNMRTIDTMCWGN